MLRPRLPWLLLAALLPGAAAADPADAGQAPPATGRQVLEAMHAAYAGRWYTTLTFVQKTRKRTPSGQETVETWYESLRHTGDAGTQLRIDTGPPAEGNGVIYTAGEALGFRDGKQVAARPAGNALLPLIEGVYLQPVERTLAELAPTGVDFARPPLPGQWEGRAVWVVGARDPADLRSPQLWVDVERMLVVRAILVPVPGARQMDIRLGGVVPLAQGWLATRCDFYVDGALAQAEAYQDWKAGRALSPALFDPRTFATAPHWAR